MRRRAPSPRRTVRARRAARAAKASTAALPHDGASTNHFVVADRRGDVVSYTNTIEELGGSGIVVPGRGFLLNNELTDFDFAPLQKGVPDPNLPAAGKRPRSSMSPTIVLRNGKPFMAVGAAGGATIITTVLQILINRIDLGMNLPAALDAPRASQRNGTTTQAEPAFLAQPTTAGPRAPGPEVRGGRHLAAEPEDQDRARRSGRRRRSRCSAGAECRPWVRQAAAAAARRAS